MNDPTAGTTAQPNISADNQSGNDTRPRDTLHAPGNADAEAKSGAPETAQAPPKDSPAAHEASGGKPDYGSPKR